MLVLGYACRAIRHRLGSAEAFSGILEQQRELTSWVKQDEP